MFSNKISENGKINEAAKSTKDLNEKINKELVVHNMPPKSVLSGLSSLTRRHRGNLVSAGLEPTEHSHKKVGVFIIIGGLVLIAGIAYGAYVFVIKPASQPVSAPTAKLSQEVKINVADNDISAATPVLTATSAVPIIDVSIASGSELVASSTDLLATSSAWADGLNPSPGQAVAVIDTDSDGLNDVEEMLLGSNPNASDSDEDSYPDLAELLIGYDPASTGSLLGNSNISEYPGAGYSILYPKIWTPKPMVLDNGVIFTAADDSFVQISVQKNEKKQDIATWYKQQFALNSVSAQQSVQTKFGPGILSEDFLTVYFADSTKENIYVLSYTPVVSNSLVYADIFKMMVNSLAKK